MAVPETDDARREGLLRLADGWVAMAQRNTRPSSAYRV